MKTIKLNSGFEALVDDSDYESVMQYKWYTSGTKPRIYAKTDIYNKSERTYLYLHHLVFGEKWVDHINGNTLDNTRSNLRKVTHQQNMWNSRGYAESGYKGVYRSNKHTSSLWSVRISKDGQKYYWGGFTTAVDAANFYNEKAREFHGEFARLNEVKV